MSSDEIAYTTGTSVATQAGDCPDRDHTRADRGPLVPGEGDGRPGPAVAEGSSTIGTDSLLGYDVLRIASMILVALQHLFTLAGLDHDSDLFRLIRPGQTGVTTFCALSGFLAMHSGGRRHWRWLGRRLIRIYPSYWIVLAGVLAINAIVHYKPITWDQAVCQFLGIGLFTHGAALVGVHTWFVSLILTCYLLAFLIRWRGWLLPLFLAATVPLVPYDTLFAGHVLSFLCGAVLARLPRPGIASALLALGCLAADRFYHPGFLVPAFGMAALGIASLLRQRSPRPVTVLSRGTYEFYLVHGPVYLGFAKVLGLGIVGNAFIGTPVAVLGSYLLIHASQWTTKVFLANTAGSS